MKQSRLMKIDTAVCRYGTMSFIDNDMFIGKSLRAYGDYCEDEPRLWRKLIKPGATVVDVGANIGALTLALADIVGPKGRVLAIEAQMENYDLLEKNVVANELSSVVTTLWRAASDSFTNLSIPELDELGHQNYGRVILGSGSSVVSTTTLDKETEGVPIDFVKIDVEGYEANVLRGARKMITRCRPILYVENDRPDKETELIGLIRSLGYRIFEHRANLFSLDNYNSFYQNVIGNYESLNILCIPTEKIWDYVDVTRTLKAIIPATPTCGKSNWVGIARFGGVGDNLIAASVLRPLKARGYNIEVLSQEPQSVVYENNPFIDKLTIKDPHRDLPQGGPQDWQNWFRGRAREYNRFFHFSHSCENLVASFPASTQFYWPANFRRRVSDYSYIEIVHDIAEVPYEFGRLFFPTDEEIEQALITKERMHTPLGGGSKTAGPVIGWCLTGTRIDKIYPHSPMVIARLIKELGANVVMMGAPAPSHDHDFARQIQDYVRLHNGTDAGLFEAISPPNTNTWPIRRCLSFAMVCDLFITPDTGPAWAVAFEQLPKIVLLGHASAKNITHHWVNTVTLQADPNEVPCCPCHCLHDEIGTCWEKQEIAGMKVDKQNSNPACIRSITTEAVVTTANRLLNGSSE